MSLAHKKSDSPAPPWKIRPTSPKAPNHRCFAVAETDQAGGWGGESGRAPLAEFSDPPGAGPGEFVGRNRRNRNGPGPRGRPVYHRPTAAPSCAWRKPTPFPDRRKGPARPEKVGFFPAKVFFRRPRFGGMGPGGFFHNEGGNGNSWKLISMLFRRAGRVSPPQCVRGRRGTPGTHRPRAEHDGRRTESRCPRNVGPDFQPPAAPCGRPPFDSFARQPRK